MIEDLKRIPDDDLINYDHQELCDLDDIESYKIEIEARKLETLNMIAERLAEFIELNNKK